MTDKNKKKNFSEIITIPEGVTAVFENGIINFKGPKGELQKEFDVPKVNLQVSDKELIVNSETADKRVKKSFFTTLSHLKNWLKGVSDGFEYELAICSSHFPMNVSVSGNKFVVKNLFGEAYPRNLIIKEGAKVVIKEKVISVTATDKELAGQVAADIEQLTKITNRDTRIFQDGIYITKKAK